MLSETFDRRATIDHVVPRALGGPDAVENTVAACGFCNTLKGCLPEADFRALPRFSARFRLFNTPPARLSTDRKSPFYDAGSLRRGVGVRLDGKERLDVVEYFVDERWISVRANIRSLDRMGRQLTVRIRGEVDRYFRDLHGVECPAPG